MSTAIPTLSQIQKALAIAERIQQLEEELSAVMGGARLTNGSATARATAPQPVKRGPGRPRKDAAAASAPAQPAKRGRKPFSAESRAKMAAAQRARWAGKNGGSSGAAAAKPAKGGKRTMSPDVRARLAAAMKARWAGAKRKGLPAPNARK